MATVKAIPAEAGPMQNQITVSEEMLHAGKAIQRAGTPFVTAIAVQKPRNLDAIVAAIDREAEYAGDSFWYSWTQKGERVEGATIGLANSLAREWTNCAVTSDLRETEEAFYITARFIDLEKGAQMERIFRQRKDSIAGRYDPERKLDMALQVGQSKAIRNVVLNAVPRWLVERAIEKAKEAVAKKIDPKRLEEFRAEVEKYFAGKGITKDQLMAKARKPMAEWTTRDIADFRADAKALQSGEVAINDLFPSSETKVPAGPVSVEEVHEAAMQPAESSPMTEEEKRRAMEREKREAGKGKAGLF